MAAALGVGSRVARRSTSLSTHRSLRARCVALACTCSCEIVPLRLFDVALPCLERSHTMSLFITLVCRRIRTKLFLQLRIIGDQVSFIGNEVRVVGDEIPLPFTFEITAVHTGIVTFESVLFESGSTVPAIKAEGATINVVQCVFRNNLASALRVRFAAAVTIDHSVFHNNGGESKATGGAILVDGGVTNVYDSILTRNMADDGGGIHATGGASIHLYRTKLEANTATTRGGALSIAESATLRFGNETKLVGNFAPVGRSMSVTCAGSGCVQYVLPAPLGHWVANTRPCNFNNGMSCNTFIDGAHDDDFPFMCAPGEFP